MSDLSRTVFYDLHVELGARMVPFAGWEMPVQYAPGVMKEHLFTRESAGLFDVSHMGQVILRGPDVAEALERLVPVDIVGLAEGRQRYGFFTTDDGGIIDDLMITNRGDHLFLVVNAARKEADLEHLRLHLPEIEVEELTGRALIALQGPKAEDALAALNPAVREMRFMDVADVELAGASCWVSRSGYTGEDGFEISVPNTMGPRLMRALLESPAVQPIGLGARDSLRLEAGLCLYGSDIGETTSPVEAGLNWAIQTVRRKGGARAGGFPGADRILSELETGPARKRVGLLPEGRAPMRAHTALFAEAEGGAAIGEITSGAFGPSIERPMSMGYVPADHAMEGTTIFGEVRGKRLPATIAPLPFHKPSYKR
ncbi:glycine cleavage system aminomethyltransferase GcvT [Sinisalibacter aestuarii]|uniref:aminomethyltransferase n=1 Tax=Sinisalibacter aestuarii TaxID=2949426 RepID=A0ABQ5LVZ4_9RHOB|nr:glycine cleavage system aminomethyltransferase GcvT [Sinisalibacter aestuarii]GKY88406.1 aminomethyltransferase [Sinisalibacter aestuarii]